MGQMGQQGTASAAAASSSNATRPLHRSRRRPTGNIPQKKIALCWIGCDNSQSSTTPGPREGSESEAG